MSTPGSGSPLLQRRLQAALLSGDAESRSPGLSRLGAAAVAGVFLALAVVAVVGVLAVVRPGGATAWQEPGAFIVAEETGTRYVYRDGALSPIANYTSARLLLGNDFHLVTVSERSLESARRGPAIGIPLAPDALPDASAMAGTDWSVCASGAGSSGLRTSIRPGQIAAGDPVGADTGYLLRAGDGGAVLLWDGHAHAVADADLAVVGYRPADAVPVDADFLAALPAGQPLSAPEIAGVGLAGPKLPGTTEPSVVGTLFADRSNAYYVLTQAGLAALTPLQADLLRADPRLSAAYGGGSPSPLPITAAQVAASATTTLPAIAGSPPPAQAPTLGAWPAGEEQQLCLRYTEQRSPDVVIGPAQDPGGDPVQLPIGGGALAAAADAGSATTVSLITDSGVRYPVADQRTLERLGLAGVSIAKLPTGVLDLLPAGPTLDVAAAGRPAA